GARLLRRRRVEVPLGELVLAARDGKGTEPHRAVAGAQEGGSGGLDVTGRSAGGGREVERRFVVVRDELGVVVGAAERLDPRSRVEMPRLTRRTRHLPVCDVADEHVPEGELRLAADRRPPLTPDQALALERVQGVVARFPPDAGERRGGADPEDLADDRRGLEQTLLVRAQAVEARGD